MGDTLLKRERDIEEEEENANPKRHKNCNDDDDGQIIRSLLEVDEDEPHQDLSSLMTTLEQELYSDHHHQFNTTFFTACSSDTENPTSSSANSTSLYDDRDSVMRYLLEASEDELGIPNRVVEEDGNGSNNENDNNNGGDSSSVSSMSLVVEGLWELEDEAANYYTLLQSELFLQA